MGDGSTATAQWNTSHIGRQRKNALHGRPFPTLPDRIFTTGKWPVNDEPGAQFLSVQSDSVLMEGAAAARWQHCETEARHSVASRMERLPRIHRSGIRSIPSPVDGSTGCTRWGERESESDSAKISHRSDWLWRKGLGEGGG